jgi:Methyltransferase domain
MPHHTIESDKMKELDYWSIRRYRAETPIDPFSYPITSDRDGWIASRLAKCDSVLEIGSGERTFLPDLKRVGFHGAFRTMDVGSSLCDFHSLTEIREHFAGVVMREVIEHLARETFYEYLDEIHSRLLQNGGLLAITTPNPWSPQSVWARDFTHVSPWPPHDLYSLLRYFGFSRVEIVRIIWPSRALWLKRLYWAIHSKFYDLDYAGAYIALAIL